MICKQALALFAFCKLKFIHYSLILISFKSQLKFNFCERMYVTLIKLHLLSFVSYLINCFTRGYKHSQ